MLVGQNVRRVAIVGGARIPFARAMGAYAECSNQDMLTAALKGVVDKYRLAGERLGDVGAGAVLKHPRDFNLTREAVLSSGLAPETPAFDLQRACGTSLETAIIVGMKIALGQIESGIAAGVDTASDAPIGVSEGLRKLMLRSARGRSLGERLTPWLGLRPRHFKPNLPAVSEPRTGLSMGQSCELMARRWQVSREAQDELAYESHRRAAAAYDEGFYRDLVVEFQGLREDDNLRRDTTRERLAKLKPAFPIEGSGTLTAGNSTPMTDGASAVLLASERVGARARTAGAGLPELRQGGGRELRQRRGPADGARLCGAADARRMPASACRTSISTRSTRRSPPRCCARCRRGSRPSSAATDSVSPRRSARSTGRSST